jgi:hypothetical protein
MVLPLLMSRFESTSSYHVVRSPQAIGSEASTERPPSLLVNAKPSYLYGASPTGLCTAHHKATESPRVRQRYHCHRSFVRVLFGCWRKLWTVR